MFTHSGLVLLCEKQLRYTQVGIKPPPHLLLSVPAPTSERTQHNEELQSSKKKMPKQNQLDFPSVSIPASLPAALSITPNLSFKSFFSRYHPVFLIRVNMKLN